MGGFEGRGQKCVWRRACGRLWGRGGGRLSAQRLGLFAGVCCLTLAVACRQSQHVVLLLLASQCGPTPAAAAPRRPAAHQQTAHTAHSITRRQVRDPGNDKCTAQGRGRQAELVVGKCCNLQGMAVDEIDQQRVAGGSLLLRPTTACLPAVPPPPVPPPWRVVQAGLHWQCRPAGR